jgi:hypothetical protein
MGLTGAGKSTFISVATDREDIPIGDDGDLDPVTQDVQDYVLQMRQNGVYYEVHLIDTRGGKLSRAFYISTTSPRPGWVESGNETFACWRR